MKRTVKKPELRRLEILETAKTLFSQNGYTNTTVDTIIQEAGIAKGTFYYYFASKKEIVEALSQHLVLGLLQHFEKIITNENLSATQKLKLLLRGSEKKTIIQSPITNYIHLPENRELQEQLNIQIIELFAPLIAQVLEQGKQEGAFTIEYPLETAQLLLAGSQFVLDSGLFHWSATKHANLLTALQKIFELSTGAKPGTFNFLSEEA